MMMTDNDDILSNIDKSNTVQPTEENSTILDHSVQIKPPEDTTPQPAEDGGNAPAAAQRRPQRGRGRKAREVVRVNPELVENECDKLIQEMEAAYISDLENNQVGKPSLNKLKVLDRVVSKLRSTVFAEVFLNKNGLEQFHNFLKRLPDGSWPLSSIRKSIYQTLLALPYNEHHLKYTKLGKTLTLLQKSKAEYEENKKLIQDIKDKWSRIVCGISMDYTDLESAEKENYKLMKKKRKRTSTRNFAASIIDSKLTQNTNTKKVKMAYNFSIRPASLLTKREGRKLGASKTTQEIDKYLTKIRKKTKMF